ncbi:MAG: SCO family protein [Paracoccaceae bacterium]
MPAKPIAVAASVLVALALAAGAWTVLRHRSDDRFAECRASVTAGGTKTIGGPFTLTDHHGNRVTEADVIKGLTLIYFGYTYCPDVCPLDNARNAEAVDILKERGVDVTAVLISVDPERDTPEAMADYVGYLHPDMIGLTGSAEEVAAAAAEYRAFYARNGSGEDYLMNHSTFTYLMAPGEGFLDFFTRDVSAEDMADRVGCFAASLPGIV